MVLESLLKHGILRKYPRSFSSCAAKLEYWRSNGLRNQLYELEMIKTILFSFQREGQEKYILASTLGQERIDLNELRVELGLSGPEATTISYDIDDDTIKAVTGKRRGAVSPFVTNENIDIYFCRDLLRDMRADSKSYDIPLSLKSSVFLKAADLYALVKKNNYEVPGEFEDALPLEITDLKVKSVDASRAGYALQFAGTQVRYRGQEYEIKNPRMKKEETPRRRKEIGTIALPLTKIEGKVEYEMTERGRKRVLLPLDYETLENAYLNQGHLFQRRNKIM